MSLEECFTIENCILCGSQNQNRTCFKESSNDLNPFLQTISRLLKLNDNIIDPFSVLLKLTTQDNRPDFCNYSPPLCDKCQDRIENLSELFIQLDWVNQCISDVHDAVVKDFLAIKNTGIINQQQNDGCHGGEDEHLNVELKLRKFIADQIRPENSQDGPPEELRIIESDTANVTEPDDEMGFDYDDEMLIPENIPQLLELPLANLGIPEVRVENSTEDRIKTRTAFVKIFRLTPEEISKYSAKKRSAPSRKSKSKALEGFKNVDSETIDEPAEKFTIRGSRVRKNKATEITLPFRCVLKKCIRKKMYFETQELMDEHVARIHKSFECKKCKRAFKHKIMLDCHLRSHENDQPCSCSECGRNFQDTWALKVHMSTHNGDSLFKCTECPKIFKSHHGLNYHIRIQHTQEKVAVYRKQPETENQRKYRCTYENCKRTIGFESELHLQSHVAKKHEGQTHPYECPDCHRKFKQPREFEKHLKTHVGDFPCYCSYCGRGYTSAFALKVHQVVHTGELIYKCKECPRAFKGHSGLRYHMRMAHSKERCYVCDYCGKGFAASDQLNRHIKSVHSTDRPEICHLCGKSFPIRNYLRIHIRVTHEKHKYGKLNKNNKIENINHSDTQTQQERDLKIVPRGNSAIGSSSSAIIGSEEPVEFLRSSQDICNGIMVLGL